MDLDFNLHMPTRLSFGRGRFNELGLAEMPACHCMLVAGATGAVRETGLIDRTLSLLEQAGVEVTLHERSHPTATVEEADAIAERIRATGSKFIVALGGASTIDAAKAGALAATNSGRYWDMVPFGTGGRRRIEAPALPLIALPTIGGAGSEVSPWAVLTNTLSKERIAWGADSMFPMRAIVDPDLTLNAPPRLVAASAIQALLQAMGAYLSTAAQPLTTYFSLEAVTLITKNLPLVIEYGAGDPHMHMRLSWAATESGICQAHSSSISLLAIQCAVESECPWAERGVIPSALALPYYRLMAGRVPSRLAKLAAVMGGDLGKPESSATDFLELLGGLIRAAGFGEARLSALGLDSGSVPRIARRAHETMDVLYRMTPAPMTEEDTARVIEEAL